MRKLPKYRVKLSMLDVFTLLVGRVVVYSIAVVLLLYIVGFIVNLIYPAFASVVDFVLRYGYVFGTVLLVGMLAVCMRECLPLGLGSSDR